MALNGAILRAEDHRRIDPLGYAVHGTVEMTGAVVSQHAVAL